MKCDQFNNLAIDLARAEGRGQRIGGETPDELAQHVLACRRCAARLDAERGLSARLRDLAEAEAMEEAPLRVEARLVEEFRAHGPHRIVRGWASIAAACAILAVSLLGALIAFHRKLAAPASQPIARPANPGRSCCTQRADGVLTERPQITPTAHAGRKRVTAKVHKPLRRTPDSERTSGEVNAELATEFIPVPYGNSLDPITGGQIVRIRLPRSAMGAVGLPMNQETLRGQVDADVLMDQNMTMRAIRFVQ